MTELYRDEEVTRVESKWIGTKCDGCGLVGNYYFVRVSISVNVGEEYGGTNDYDYCENCLLERAPLLVAAGSTAPIVTGNDE